MCRLFGLMIFVSGAKGLGVGSLKSCQYSVEKYVSYCTGPALGIVDWQLCQTQVLVTKSK